MNEHTELARKLRGQYTQDVTSENLTAAADAIDALVAERDLLKEALRQAVATFVHPTHPGRSCLQSGHVNVETVAKWRAVLGGME